MADCFDSVTLDNPLRYYKNYSFNACMSESKAMCHAEHCGCRDVLDPRKYPLLSNVSFNLVKAPSHPSQETRRSERQLNRSYAPIANVKDHNSFTFALYIANVSCKRELGQSNNAQLLPTHVTALRCFHSNQVKSCTRNGM